jgi:hypothetical protein
MKGAEQKRREGVFMARSQGAEQGYDAFATRSHKAWIGTETSRGSGGPAYGRTSLLRKELAGFSLWATHSAEFPDDFVYDRGKDKPERKSPGDVFESHLERRQACCFAIRLDPQRGVARWKAG